MQTADSGLKRKKRSKLTHTKQIDDSEEEGKKKERRVRGLRHSSFSFKRIKKKIFL